MSELAGRSFLITGATGYLGTALAAALAQHPCTVQLVSRSTPAAIPPGTARVAAVTADLRDPAQRSRLLRGVDTVFHLSAQTNLRFAEAHPQEDADANVTPVTALVAAAAASEPVRVVFASTATVVGVPERLRVDGSMPDRPVSVYDRHKLQAELVLREAVTRGLVRACSLRLANVYGFGTQSRNSDRSVLNFMMRRALEGQPLTLYGDGRYVRDFTHVTDVVAAFLAAANAPAAALDGRPFLVGTGVGHSLAAAFEMVAEEAAALTGTRVAVASVPEPEDLHPIERRSAIVDPSAFRDLTGWTAKTGLRAGLASDLSKYMASVGKSGPAAIQPAASVREVQADVTAEGALT